MPSGSSRTVERIEAGKADGDARMRQLIMELTRAQSAAALPAPAMPALTKAGGTHDRQAFLRAAQRAITRSAKPAGQYMPAPLIAAIATDATFERRAQASAKAATAANGWADDPSLTELFWALVHDADPMARQLFCDGERALPTPAATNGSSAAAMRKSATDNL